jgi:hypothetical protein
MVAEEDSLTHSTLIIIRAIVYIVSSRAVEFL